MLFREKTSTVDKLTEVCAATCDLICDQVKVREKIVWLLEVSQANKIDTQRNRITQLQKMNRAQALQIRTLQKKPKSKRKKVTFTRKRAKNGKKETPAVEADATESLSTGLDILATIASQMLDKN